MEARAEQVRVEEGGEKEKPIFYDRLDDSNWAEIRALFESRGIPVSFIPHPDMALAVGAFEQGEGAEPDTLVGVLFLQMCWHMEPLVVSEGAAGRVSASVLKAAVESLVRPVLAGTGPVQYYVQLKDDPAVRMTAEREGLRPVEGKVLYAGRIGPGGPSGSNGPG